MTHKSDILRVLKETSRTFFIPIVRLPTTLQETIGAAYLCMRAIDEIEDHPGLDNQAKASILHGLSWALQAQLASDDPANGSLLEAVFLPYRKILPEVTLRISDWLSHLPLGIAPRVWDATIAMADRMAYWVENNWLIRTEADLNSYTFSVAGAVGLRNREEDARRGVNFFPSGWDEKQMFVYARKNIGQAKAGISLISQQSFRGMVDIPLALAEATLHALENGQAKLTRTQVMQIVGQI
jgi:farnesyl-diphosphate farnesyltransferase